MRSSETRSNVRGELVIPSRLRMIIQMQPPPRAPAVAFSPRSPGFSLEDLRPMSSKFVRFFGVALVLCCATLFTIAQDAKTADSIQKQADDVTKKDWKALSKQGEALAKTHDLADVMNLMRTRKLDEKGNIEVKTSGVGVGKEPGKIKPDGIEAKIINMKRNPMPA